jgi:hypothetical protein
MPVNINFTMPPLSHLYQPHRIYILDTTTLLQGTNNNINIHQPRSNLLRTLFGPQTVMLSKHHGYNLKNGDFIDIGETNNFVNRYYEIRRNRNGKINFRPSQGPYVAPANFVPVNQQIQMGIPFAQLQIPPPGGWGWQVERVVWPSNYFRNLTNLYRQQFEEAIKHQNLSALSLVTQNKQLPNNITLKIGRHMGYTPVTRQGPRVDNPRRKQRNLKAARLVSREYKLPNNITSKIGGHMGYTPVTRQGPRPRPQPRQKYKKKRGGGWFSKLFKK